MEAQAHRRAIAVEGSMQWTSAVLKKVSATTARRKVT